MKVLQLLALTFCLAVFAPTVLRAGEIVTEEVAYRTGKVRAKGYLATPKEEGPHPGVLVLHEWWGHNDYARKRAEMLAELGYTALAVDLYGGGTTALDPQNAARLSVQIQNNQPELAARFKESMGYLQRRAETDPEKIAAVGYGFGGNVVLQMARNGIIGLDGVAAFHPALTLKLRTPNPPVKTLTARIVVFHGGEDPFINLRPGVVEDFQKTMRSVKADMTFITYPDAMRSFYNPDATKIGEKFNIPFVYNQAADTASWKELQAFLEDLWEEKPTGE